MLGSAGKPARRIVAVCAIAPVGLLLLATVSGCQPTSSHEPGRCLNVLVAASTLDVFQQVAREFESTHGGQVRLVSGSSHALAQQILAGAPAGVFVSANQRWADAVTQAGLAADVAPLFSNRLVLIVPKGNPAGLTAPQDLQRPQVNRVAIADENTPAGIYAAQALQYHQLLQSPDNSRKLVRGGDARMTLTLVQRGEVDAAIVYATDAMITDQVEVVSQFDRQAHSPIVYVCVLLKNPRGPDTASHRLGRQFFDFLQTPAARQVFLANGFAELPKADVVKRGADVSR